MATFHKYKKKGSNKDFWEYRIYDQDPISRKTKEKSKKDLPVNQKRSLQLREWKECCVKDMK